MVALRGKRQIIIFFIKSMDLLVAWCLEATMTFKEYFNYFRGSLLKTSGETGRLEETSVGNVHPSCRDGAP